MALDTEILLEKENEIYTKYYSFDQIDKDKFKQLLEDGSGKKLVEDYFSYLDPKYIVIAHDKNTGEYLSTIVLEQIPDTDILYLDKIVTCKSKQKNGIGKKMWALLNGDSKKTVWRATPYNSENVNYLKHSKGHQRMENWIVYWNGLSPEELKIGIDYAMSKKETLIRE